MTQNRRRDYRPGSNRRTNPSKGENRPDQTKAERRRKRQETADAEAARTDAPDRAPATASASPFAGDNRRAALAMAVICPVLASLFGNMGLAAVPLDWYRGLELPRFALPTAGSLAIAGAFYLGYGIAIYRLWRRQAWGLVRLAILVLAANEIWTLVLFGLRDLGLAMAATVLLAGLGAVQAWRTVRIDGIAGGIAAAYCLWVICYDLPLVFWLMILNG